MQKKQVGLTKSLPVPLEQETTCKIIDHITIGRKLHIDPVNLIKRFSLGRTFKIQEQTSKAFGEKHEIIKQLNDIKMKVSNWERFVPRIKKYLTSLCDNFKAGNVSKKFSEWKKITSDKDILSDIRGMSIECTDIPEQHYLRPPSFSQTESMIIDMEVGKLLTKEVIKPVANKGEGIISNIFIRSKKDGSHRLILNLKEFNKNIAYYHFKMDSLNTIIKLMQKDCFMASIDIKDAYYSIAVREPDQKYLQFQWKGIVYHFTCLPNGLTSGPRKFTKL